MEDTLDTIVAFALCGGMVVLVIWIARRRHGPTFDELMNRAAELQKRGVNPDEESSTSLHVALDDEGFHVLKDGEAVPVGVVRWCDVREIRAYKRDLLSYDRICLAFQVGEDDWVEIGEGDARFRAASERARQVFPSIPADWFHDVMLPAFETKETVLFRRD